MSTRPIGPPALPILARPVALTGLRRAACCAAVTALAACTGGATARLRPEGAGGDDDGVGGTERGITVPLVRLEDEPPGDNCPGGGVAVDAGIDADEDGLLGDAEVQERFYVCHGEAGGKGDQGADGARSLVRLTPEEPGDRCVDGGVRVDSGLDLDGDEALADEEVQSTAWVCHGARGADGAPGADGAGGEPGEAGAAGAPGADGPASLLRLTRSQPGDACLAGGVRVEAGLDVDGDGELGDDEVTASETVCDGQHGRDGRDGEGAGGPGALLRLLPIGPGEACASGGVLVQVGVDDDGDGELADDEVDQEAPICHGSLCDSPEFHDGGDGSCIQAGRCLDGYHDGGDGSCVPVGGCAEGHRDGGGGRCVPEGECAPGFRPDPLGGEGCVPACEDGEHDDGAGGCVPLGECAEGFHDGGEGDCVPVGDCAGGFRDGGDGSCWPFGECARRYIDINGVCVLNDNSLFDFETHTFTTCGASGRSGPSVDQCAGAYAAAEWAADRELFDVAGGIQRWTVPQDGTYRIEVWGAQGGGAGGNGAYLAGDLELDLGDVLQILVGQQGGDSPAQVGDGGGGGTFVVLEEGDTPLVIAGGGGGTGHNNARTDVALMQGQVGAAGNPGHHANAGAGGQDGNGGEAGFTTGNPSVPNAGGGGGFLTDGGSAGAAQGGQAFLNGGLGGDSTGGFGGGGGSNVFVYGCGNSPHGGSGGGGWSGGGGGGTNCNGVGGGGGSLNAGANPASQVGARAGHGRAVIVLL